MLTQKIDAPSFVILYTVKNNLHKIIGFVLSTINFVASTNWYGQKKDLEKTTDILYHLFHFYCTILQQNVVLNTSNWVENVKLV